MGAVASNLSHYSDNSFRPSYTSTKRQRKRSSIDYAATYVIVDRSLIFQESQSDLIFAKSFPPVLDSGNSRTLNSLTSYAIEHSFARSIFSDESYAYATCSDDGYHSCEALKEYIMMDLLFFVGSSISLDLKSEAFLV